MRIMAVLTLFVGLSWPAAGAVTVDLRQAERLALERNLNLRAQSYGTLAAESVVRRSYGLYDPLGQLDVSYADTEEPLNSIFATLGGFSPSTKTSSSGANFRLSQQIPWGGTAAVDYVNLWEDTHSLPQPAIDPSWTSELRFSLTQPLLQGLGRTVTEQNILFAVKDREISVQDLRSQAFDTLVQVRDTFFDILAYRENLDYWHTSVELARTVLKENQARVEAGVMAPVEVLDARVGLQLRERELLDAERQYQDAIDQLNVLLALDQEVEVAAIELTTPALKTDAESGLAAALVKRPDVQRQMRQIERSDLDQEIAKDKVLPTLDLTGSYSRKGLAEDYSGNLDNISGNDFPNWQIALTLAYPLGNREARNDLARARFQGHRQEALLGQLRHDIQREIRAAIRLLDVSQKKVDVTRLGRELAQERLRTLLKRKEVGLATTRDVLEGEEDLAQARIDQITALADYNKAITEYLRATGRLLEHEGVTISGDFDLKEPHILLTMKPE